MIITCSPQLLQGKLPQSPWVFKQTWQLFGVLSILGTSLAHVCQSTRMSVGHTAIMPIGFGINEALDFVWGIELQSKMWVVISFHRVIECQLKPYFLMLWVVTARCDLCLLNTCCLEGVNFHRSGMCQTYQHFSMCPKPWVHLSGLYCFWYFSLLLTRSHRLWLGCLRGRGEDVVSVSPHWWRRNNCWSYNKF